MTGIIVSYSELFKFDTCQRQYWYSFGLGLRPVEVSQPISIGNKGHSLLQVFYTSLQKGKTPTEAHKVTQEAAASFLKKEHVSSAASLLIAWTMVDNYIRDFEYTAKAILVENRFQFPVEKLIDSSEAERLGIQGVSIGFTPDLVVERTGGFLDVEDYKFVGRAWPTKKINRFQQAKLYQIFLKRMGYNVSRSSVRFFMLETGKIINHPYPLTPEEEAALIHDFVNGIADVVRYRDQPTEVKQQARRTMNYTACQFCHYEFPCTLEAQGKDARKTLENLYVKSTYDYST